MTRSRNSNGFRDGLFFPKKIFFSINNRFQNDAHIHVSKLFYFTLPFIIPKQKCLKFFENVALLSTRG